MTRTERAMALLQAADPIIGSYAKEGPPCGDPMGSEYWSEDYRLSELLAEGGWPEARKHREVSRLLVALIDSSLPLGSPA